MSARLQHRTRRGQPVVVLVSLLLAWIGMRTAIGMAGVYGGDASAGVPTVAVTQPRARADSDSHRQDDTIPALPMPNDRGPIPLAPVYTGPQVLPPAPLGPRPAAVWSLSQLSAAWKPGHIPLVQRERFGRLEDGSAAVRHLASHQLLYAAGLGSLAYPAEAPNPRSPGPALARPRRWSFDAWMLWRQGAASPVPLVSTGGAYGASQSGAVLRYRLGERSALSAYIRTSAPLDRPDDAELAAGLLTQPWSNVPLRTFAEVRAQRSGGAIRPRAAAGIILAAGAVRLPFGFRAEPYGQTGYVTGADATLFVDGQIRADRRIMRLAGAELRAGGGIWGGAQRGAARLDAGPAVTLQFPLGPAQARLSADWRQRLAGKAAPASGMAVTLATGF